MQFRNLVSFESSLAINLKASDEPRGRESFLSRLCVSVIRDVEPIHDLLNFDVEKTPDPIVKTAAPFRQHGVFWHSNLLVPRQFVQVRCRSFRVAHFGAWEMRGQTNPQASLSCAWGCEFLRRMFVVPPSGGIGPQKFRLKRASSLGNWKLAKKMASQGCLFRTTGASEFLSQRANSSLSMFRKRKQSVFVRLRSR